MEEQGQINALSYEQKREIAVELLKNLHPSDLQEIIKEAVLEQSHLPDYPNLRDLNSGETFLLQLWLLLFNT